MEKTTKQILKTFTLDAETLEAMAVLKNQGYNISSIIREFLKTKASTYTKKTN